MLYDWLPVAIWMGVIFYLSAQPDLPHPKSGWLDFAISSAAHVALFGVLAALLARAFGHHRHGVWLAAMVAIIYGALDELHQAYVPGRHPDIIDLVADSLGVLLGLTSYWVLRNHKARQG